MKDLLGGIVCAAVLMLIVCIIGGAILAFENRECVMCEGTGRYFNSACIFCD